MLDNSNTKRKINFAPLAEQMRKSQTSNQLPLPTVKHQRSMTSMIGLSEVDENGANSLLTKMKNHNSLKSIVKKRNTEVFNHRTQQVSSLLSLKPNQK